MKSCQQECSVGSYWSYFYIKCLYKQSFYWFSISACELVASRIFFDDDSCPDSYKYMKVCYECAYDESNAVDVLKMQKRRRKRKRGTFLTWFESVDNDFLSSLYNLKW